MAVSRKTSRRQLVVCCAIVAASISCAGGALGHAGEPDPPPKQGQPPVPGDTFDNRIRLKGLELDQKAAELQLERERTKQMEAVLAVKERVVALEAPAPTRRGL